METRMTHCLVFLTLTLLIASCATVEDKPDLPDFIGTPDEINPRPDQAYIERISQMTRTELEAEIAANSEEFTKTMVAEKKARSIHSDLEKQYDEGNISDASIFSEILMARAAMDNEYYLGKLLENKRWALLIAYRKLLWIEKGYKR